LVFADNEYTLAETQKDGCSYRDHLKLIEERSGKIQEELHFDPIPNSCLHVWEWFLQLDSSRQSGMQANPISFSDIQAFFQLHNVQPDDWEISLIKQLDRIALKHHNKPSK
jgi:hypothetical protein